MRNGISTQMHIVKISTFCCFFQEKSYLKRGELGENLRLYRSDKRITVILQLGKA